MNSVTSFFKFAAKVCGTDSGDILPNLYKNISCEPDKNNNMIPAIKSIQDVFVIATNAIEIAVAVAGGLAVIILIVASIYFVTSMGDPARIKKAKEIIQNTVIGLGLILSVYAIITFISGNF